MSARPIFLLASPIEEHVIVSPAEGVDLFAVAEDYQSAVVCETNRAGWAVLRGPEWWDPADLAEAMSGDPRLQAVEHRGLHRADYQVSPEGVATRTAADRAAAA